MTQKKELSFNCTQKKIIKLQKGWRHSAECECNFSSSIMLTTKAPKGLNIVSVGSITNWINSKC